MKNPEDRRAYDREYIKRPHAFARRKRYSVEWRKKNTDKIAKYDAKSAPRKREHTKAVRRERRKQVIDLLGGKCASENCRWLNDDGTLGCTNELLLQIDHKKGGGTQERAKLSYDRMLRLILSGKTKPYQLLCAGCNWLKAHTHNEFQCMEGTRR
jgi:hypothetical protein